MKQRKGGEKKKKKKVYAFYVYKIPYCPYLINTSHYRKALLRKAKRDTIKI